MNRPLAFLSMTLLALGLPACGGGGAGGAGGGAILDGSPQGGDTPVAPAASPGRVVIDPISPEALAELCKAKGATIVSPCEGTDYCLVEIPKDTTVEKFLKDIEDEPTVEDAQPDENAQFPEGGGSTIPAFVDEDLSGVQAQLALDHVGIPDARRHGHFGQGVIVAVIDTGVAKDHPLLAGRLVMPRDFLDGDDDPADVGNGIDDDHNGLVDEGVGHGTFVASLILAVAPGCHIMPIRALDSDATGSAGAITRAIAYAVQNGADVINFSGGLRRDLRMIQQVLEYAKSSNVPVVCAAGNRAGPVDFPASVETSVAVTSLGLDDVKSAFASFGPEVDLCAPGEDLLGAHPLSPSGLARWSGTSFSTALVSGAIALLHRGTPVPYEELVDRLRATAVSVDEANPDYAGELGAGRIDLEAATED